MTPGARESDALLVAMYERKPHVNDPLTMRQCVKVVNRWAIDLGFGALVTGDYGEADR